MIGTTGKLIWLFFSNNTIDYSYYSDEDAYINSYTDTNSNNLIDAGEIVSLTISHPNYGGNYDFEYTGLTVNGYPVYSYKGGFCLHSIFQ